jgi:hypothetical protein
MRGRGEALAEPLAPGVREEGWWVSFLDPPYVSRLSFAVRSATDGRGFVRAEMGRKKELEYGFREAGRGKLTPRRGGVNNDWRPF